MVCLHSTIIEASFSATLSGFVLGEQMRIKSKNIWKLLVKDIIETLTQEQFKYAII